MATDVVDDQEMREAQRDYLDFLDDDVSQTFIRLHVLPWSAIRNHVVTTKELTLACLVRHMYVYLYLYIYICVGQHCCWQWNKVGLQMTGKWKVVYGGLTIPSYSGSAASSEAQWFGY